MEVTLSFFYWFMDKSIESNVIARGIELLQERLA